MKNRINLLTAFVCIAIVVIVSGVTVAAEPPHPYHVSMAEINWNPKSQKFEIALCLWPADLEKALAQQTGRPIDLAKEPDVDKLMETYISKRFIIHSTPRDQQPSKAKPGDDSVSAPKRDSATDVVTKASSAAPTALDNTAKTAANNLQSDTATQSTKIGTIAVTVSSDAPAPQKIKWYGHEADAKKAWLFFEIAGEPGVDWRVENRVFFELNDDQLNHVQWSGTGKIETLVCDSDNPEISLPKK